jgi:hypothetical protein
MARADVIFIERPQDSHFLEICKLIKRFGIKLWVDFDDNLFCLPDWNPGKAFFDNKLNQKCMAKSMEMADIVTVATPQIKEAYLKYNKNIEVIPNAFNNYNFSLDYNCSDKNIIMWRGSTTHRGDIMPYSKHIWKVADKYEKWKFHFVGNDLWYIADNIKNIDLTNELDIIRYFNRIKSINPAIYIAPLDFCKFNEAKSNCGWLETTFAGAVTLAPNMPEWKRPGITNYDSPGDFEDKLQLLMNDEKLRKANYKKSYDFIKCNLLLSNVNKKREKIIKELTK